MFFKKKNPILEENVAKQSIKKMDRVVTGLLLWGVVASIYGVKKLHDKGSQNHNESSNHHEPHIHDHEVKDHHDAHVEPEKKKQSIISRLFFGNR